MAFREIASFDVVHGSRAWPWLSFAARGGLVAFAASETTIATRRLDGDAVTAGPSFTIPPDVKLVSFAFSAGLLVTAFEGGELVVSDSTEERARASLATLLGPGHVFCALSFDRTGKHLWLSTETATETVISLLDAATLALVGTLRSDPLPRPSLHELHLHAQDDAILLLAACGEEGTFARVAGFAGVEVSAVPSALDKGGIAAGFVGFSADGKRVHLVEADELRTHAWPTLHELSSVPLADDFVSSFSGAVLGEDILIDGEDAESQDDLVMLFDRAAIRGLILPSKAPEGMWAGRLGANAIVTIEPKGEPAIARVMLHSKDAALGKRLLS